MDCRLIRFIDFGEVTIVVVEGSISIFTAAEGFISYVGILLFGLSLLGMDKGSFDKDVELCVDKSGSDNP